MDPVGAPREGSFSRCAAGRLTRGLVFLGAVLVVLAVLAAPMPGSPVPATRAQEAAEARVFTYFYYWYRPPGEDSKGQANLTNHFPPDRPPDWRSKSWYLGQFADMQAAGVDVALAVYWGRELYRQTSWSTDGLEPMIEALDELAAQGAPSPKIGLFLDTYVLEGADLTNPKKQSWLATQIKGFFRRVPSGHRATQDGRPIIWLYLSDYANGFDQDTFANLSDRLEGDLGARPFWVAETSWANPTWTDGQGRRHFDPARLMPFDAFYRWGAASSGTLFVDQPLPVASVGPGYDDSGIKWRGDGERSDRLRESGCFYARNWRKAQALGARWVAIETWNELYEGSGIAETVEWGRAYIDATATYSAAFKGGQPIALPPSCPEVPDEDQPPPDEPAPPPGSGPAAPTATPAATPATGRNGDGVAGR